jgi:ethanolamine utilization protein EutM
MLNPTSMPNRSALGLIETRGLVSAIEAADAAVKAAEVRITSVEVTVAALVTVKLEGDLGAVQAAVSAGAAAASKIGELVAAHVIPRPDDELDKILPDRAFINPADSTHSTGGAPALIPADDRLEEMTVVELRRLARAQEGFPLAGREISRANKQELVAHLRRWRDRAPRDDAGDGRHRD